MTDPVGRNRAADEDAIRALLDRQAAAWAAGDPDAYADVFTADADYVTFLGSHYKGRDAIAASYVWLFKRVLKGSRLEFGISPLRFLAPDVVLIHTQYAVMKGTRRRNQGINTSIAVRTDGRWLLAASQNTKHRRLMEKLMGKFDSRMVP